MNYITSTVAERVSRWPFLRFYDDPPDTCWDDCLDRGWRIAFGEMMWDEIKKTLQKCSCYPDGFSIQDIKEKWGQMRVEYSCDRLVENDIEFIIDKYARLSEHICIRCGRPDVGYMKHGWIYPACKKCFDEIKSASYLDYDEMFSKDRKMSDKLEWISWDSGGVRREHSVDISETANKIREHWEKMHEADR